MKRTLQRRELIPPETSGGAVEELTLLDEGEGLGDRGRVGDVHPNPPPGVGEMARDAPAALRLLLRDKVFHPDPRSERGRVQNQFRRLRQTQCIFEVR